MVEICHVCGKEKKPYTVFLKNDIISLITYEQNREDGPICERCDRYAAMTGEFKDATEEEFKNAEKAVWFASMMLKWWSKDKKMYVSPGLYFDIEKESKENSRDWEGTDAIARWCREQLNHKSRGVKCET
jgi:hypothetical protein